MKMNIIKRINEIIEEEGLGGLYSAIKRFFYWHPLSDYIDDLLVKFGKREVLVDILDSKMILDLSDKGICRDLYHNKVRETECTNIYMKLLNKVRNGNVLDIGSNIGYYVLIAAKRINGKVYAIEPDPRNFELLKRNIEINRLQKKVELYNIAFGDKKGKIRFYQSELRNWSRIARDYEKGIEVDVITIDDFINNYLIGKQISFLRFDVEGYEYFILKGAKRTLKNYDNLQIFMEVHIPLIYEYGGDASEMFKILSKYNFKIKYYVAPSVDHKIFFKNPPLRFTRKGREIPHKVLEINSSIRDFLKDNGGKKMILNEPYYYLFLEKEI